MKVVILDKILNELRTGPKPIAEISGRVGIGWKTCEKYLEGLKRLGAVVEIKTPKERIFILQESRKPKLLTVPKSRIGTTFEVLDEKAPKPEEIEDLT